MPFVRLVCCIVMACTLLAQMGSRPALALQRPAAPRAQPPSELPPECRSRTPFKPVGAHWWAFVLNFNVPLTSCVLIFNNTPDNRSIAYKSLPTCVPSGDVTFRNGRAFFNGGRISCSVNLYETVNALMGREVLTQTGTYDFFYMLGRGTLSSTLSTTPTSLSNAIITYRPANTETLRVGLSTPIVTLTPSLAMVASHFNQMSLVNASCGFAFGDALQTWAFTQDARTVTHWANGEPTCQFQRLNMLRLWQDGGEFIIGDGPSGGDVRDTGFRGMLEEVVVDPGGATRPPSANSVDFQIFLPLILQVPQ